MKRTLSLILALVMAVSLMACGKKDDGKNNADAPADSLALLTKVWDSYTDDEKFPAAGGDYETSVDDAPGAFDPSNADNLNFLLTVPTEDASLIDDAASLMHMMNANTFTCGALRVKNGDDAAKLAEDLRDAIQNKQWMCGFPDKLVIATLGNYVVSVYGDEELVNTFRDKLQAAFSAGYCDDARTKAAIGAAALDGMPRGKGGLPRGLEMKVMLRETLEESLKREEKRLRDYEKEAREAMIGMKSGAYAFCLYYYICGMNLEDTARITDRCERQIRRYKREIEKEEKAEE